MNRILLATDGSPGAQRAAAYLAPRARRYGSEVLVVHVGEADELPGEGYLRRQCLPAAGLDNPTREQVGHLRGAWPAVTSASSIFREHGIAVTTHVRQSAAYEEVICAVAEERGCDLIVVGRRGLNPVLELIFGSVSEGVLKRSRLPVLVVP